MSWLASSLGWLVGDVVRLKSAGGVSRLILEILGGAPKDEGTLTVDEVAHGDEIMVIVESGSGGLS